MGIAVVLEKPAPRVDEGEIKDGFHIRFPHFIISQQLGDGYFRNKLITQLENEKLFDDILSNNHTLKQVVDPVMKKNWLLYGSSKNNSAGYWIVSKIYDLYLNEIDYEQAFPVLQDKETYKKTPEYYLPLLLSVSYISEPQKAQIRKGLVSTVNKKRQRHNTFIEHNRSEDEVLKDLTWIRESGIMDLLSQERCDVYLSWLDVGWTLYGISQGHPAGLTIWREWSEGSENYEEDCCDNVWVKMKDRGKTLGSLKMYAKLDSPDKYNELVKTGIDQLINDVLSRTKPTELLIANIVEKLYGDRFKCVNSKNNKWLEFRNHIWRELDDGHSIRRILQNEVRNLFLESYMSLNRSDDNQDNDLVERRKKKIFKVIEFLEGHTFIEGVLKTLKTLLHDPFFKDKTENVKGLYAFNNGVYDTELHLFRPGSPDDNLTQQSRINYCNPDPENLEKCKKWLRQVYPNQNIRRYWMRCQSSVFIKGNRDKKIWIHTGKGNGGKSIVEKALEMLHGRGKEGYVCKLQREFILQSDQKSSGGPSIALYRTKGKNLVMMDEIGENEPMNMGLLKALSGNDSMFARTHQQEGEEMDADFKFIMFMNKPPRIPSSDDALFIRLRLIDHEACFGAKPDGTLPPEDEEEQFQTKHFPADPSFKEDTLPYLIEPLAWLLIEELKLYQKYGLEEPEEVKLSTARYRKFNDTFLQFIDDKLEKVEDDKKMVSLTEMVNIFNDWFKETYPGAKNIYGKPKIKDEINAKFMEIGLKGKWYGVKIKNDIEMPVKEISKLSLKLDKKQ